ncbi:MAG TPA: universal stress protein [Anaeromyxobacteraceae bacterium]|nr:universal stress protein [Anaeromyxobacteraceae bacterium]
MFQHLLVPTDGSPSSIAAAGQAVALAARLGARVTALTVKPAFHVFTLRPEAIEDTKGDSWDVDLHAKGNLAAVEKLAAAAKVPFEGVAAQGDQPWKVILETARAKGCDAIAMASHGRAGLERLLLGSQTQRVLAHATVPVIVFR